MACVKANDPIVKANDHVHFPFTFIILSLANKNCWMKPNVYDFYMITKVVLCLLCSLIYAFALIILAIYSVYCLFDTHELHFYGMECGFQANSFCLICSGF